MIPRRLALGFGLLVPLLFAGAARAERVPVIAAASDLQFALAEIVAAFTAETGNEVKVAFGSTGTFATQFRQGAPFDMFMAADEVFALDLAREGLTKGEGRIYAEGRIVVAVPAGSPVAADGSLGSLRDSLEAGKVTRFAIANPEHAPYGKRAEEALRHAGLWQDIQPYLVLGENVSQAAQFALSGNAEGGIIAYSLALSPQLAAKGGYALIPAEWHEPLLQRMVLLKDAGPEAEAFFAYMSSPSAREIMERYGFALPAGG